MGEFPRRAFAALTALVLVGTVYSVTYNTYLDTSDPLLTNLPHRLHKTHYFSSKGNALNVLFSKRAWGWISAAFLGLYFTSPPALRYVERLYKFFAETLVWLLFTGWFFGPSLLARLTVSTGGECFVHLPSGAAVNVPENYCYSRSTVSPMTHPALFAASLAFPTDSWSQIPRLRRGHDVSGHVFLLTMGILFLSEQLHLSILLRQQPSQSKQSYVPPYHPLAMVFAFLVVLVAYFAVWTTSVYFHTPLEKFSGFRKCSYMPRLSLVQH